MTSQASRYAQGAAAGLWAGLMLGLGLASLMAAIASWRGWEKPAWVLYAFSAAFAGVTLLIGVEVSRTERWLRRWS